MMQHVLPLRICIMTFKYPVELYEAAALYAVGNSRFEGHEKIDALGGVPLQQRRKRGVYRTGGASLRA
jgi:hypothetical protein